MDAPTILKRLEALANPSAIVGMTRFGITAEKVYGVSIPNLRKLAKEIGVNHDLAIQLWEISSRESRILASLIANPRILTETEMDQWVTVFDSWEVCDQCCSNLFEKTSFAYQKCVEWSTRPEEFVKRASFVLMARLAVSDKSADDSAFDRFFPIIKREANDPRNFVKKAINWALRQIGKRNIVLNRKACLVAQDILKMDSRSAQWIAKDAFRELTSDKVQHRIKRKR